MTQNKFIGQIREFNRYAENVQKEEFKMDLLDRKILYLLCTNSRLSYTSIAKKLQTTRETVAYRVKRMNDEEFLYGYLTLLNHRKLGFKNYLIYIKLKTITNEKELLDFLIQIPIITRLKNCSGSYDIQIVFSVKTEEEFLEKFESVVNNYHQIIQHYDIFEIIEENFLGIALLLNKEEPQKLNIIERKGSTFQKEFENATFNDQFELDEKDKTILEILKLDGRATIKDLSEKISLAPVAVENRIKKMINSGIIKKFIPLASLSKLNYQWWKVFFKFKNIDKQKFLTFLEYHPNILWYMKLLGKWDYQFSVFAKDNAEFHKVIDEIRKEFGDNIINYDSIIIFNQFKYTQRVE